MSEIFSITILAFIRSNVAKATELLSFFNIHCIRSTLSINGVAFKVLVRSGSLQRKLCVLVILALKTSMDLDPLVFFWTSDIFYEYIFQKYLLFNHQFELIFPLDCSSWYTHRKNHSIMHATVYNIFHHNNIISLCVLNTHPNKIYNMWAKNCLIYL